MKQKNKKLWNKVISMILAISMIYGGLSSGVPAVFAEDANETTPTSYTVTMHEASDVKLFTKTPSDGPVTITYTVKSSDTGQRYEAGYQNVMAVIATTDSTGTNYLGNNGSEYYTINKNFVCQDNVYQYVISTNPETGKAQVDFYQNGSANNQFTKPYHYGIAGNGNIDSKYFGLHISQFDNAKGTRTAVLTDVTCVDANGNDLGLWTNSKNVVVEANKADETPATYTVSLDNVTEMVLFSEKASDGPVTIKYTVESSNANGYQGTHYDTYSLISCVDPSTEHNNSQCSYMVTRDNGANLLYPGQYTYTITTNKSTGRISSITASNSPTDLNNQTNKFYGLLGTGNLEAKYFGFAVNASDSPRTAVLKNVSIVDSMGRDLGVQSFSEGVTVEKDVPTQPVTYTVNMNGLTSSDSVFISNELPANGPVTLEYTVQSSNAAGWAEKDVNHYQLLATTDSNGGYMSGKGSMRSQTNQNFLYKNTTYKYVINMDSNNYVTLDFYQNDTQVTNKFLALDGSGNAGSCYFGLMLYGFGSERNVVLTNVKIIDANGNDLGVKSTNSKVTVTKDARFTVMEEQNLDVYRRNRTSYLEPRKAGYEFAGWFTDIDGTKVLDNDAYIGKAYAKFVDAKVMDVKAQLATSPNTDETYNIRFVTTVDSEKYDKVGFKIEIPDISYTYTTEETVVYRALIAETGNGSYDEITPNSFSSISQYFTAVIVEGIPEAYFGSAIIVTPYWVTQDGTIVWANAVSKTVNEGIAANR